MAAKKAAAKMVGRSQNVSPSPKVKKAVPPTYGPSSRVARVGHGK